MEDVDAIAVANYCVQFGGCVYDDVCCCARTVLNVADMMKPLRRQFQILLSAKSDPNELKKHAKTDL